MAQDNLSFQQIYDEFRPRILRYLTRMAGESEAEDLTQDVFVRVNQALACFRGEASLATWIYQIATNIALDRHRLSVSRREGNVIDVDDIAGTAGDKDNWTGEEHTTSEDRVIRQEMNGCIREVINSLPDAYRTVIILSEIENLKDAEIAEVLSINLQAAKIRLHRARKKLREALSSACIFYRDERNELACDRKNQLVIIE
ncbi:MAG: ECF RNA polymerase sigma factor SigW [Syntrophus sp. SKADARSKE-3]|nr:ECF RNA polymerase sigma factor SigW [Syntrophus sp. SKADARSKE-3]